MLHLAYCEGKECSKRLECLRFMCLPENRAALISFEKRCCPINGFKDKYEIGDNPIREINEKLTETSTENNT